MNMLALQELGIYLDSNTHKPIQLKDLIKDQFIDGVIPSKLALTITIPADVQAELCDDLLAFEDLETKVLIHHSIEFIIHEESTLSYRMRIAPAFDSEKSDSSLTLKTTMTNPSSTVVVKEIKVRLVGKNAKADVYCACYGTDSRVFTFKTLQDHQVQDTTSNLVIKSVLDGSSKIISNNMIKIQKEAQRTVAEQSNKNIILGKRARAISNPQLEIEANDVKCKHGAAISKLDNDQLFYLQSRGVNQTMTRQMLVEAFLG